MAGRDPSAEPSPGRPLRSVATAYLIWFLVGIFGGHRFYLGDARGGRRYLAALAIGIALPVGGLAISLLTRSLEGVSLGLALWIAGLVVLLGVLGMAIVDAFRLPVLTRQANHRLGGDDAAPDDAIAPASDSGDAAR
ncbi:MAG: TM2 domain-containing protein [Candidatus Limnocylindrales bacterium]